MEVFSGLGAFSAVWSQKQLARQTEISAKLAAEKHDYSMALDAACRAMNGGGGSAQVAQHNGRWFAVIDSDSVIPKVKKRDST